MYVPTDTLWVTLTDELSQGAITPCDIVRCACDTSFHNNVPALIFVSPETQYINFFLLPLPAMFFRHKLFVIGVGIHPGG